MVHLQFSAQALEKPPAWAFWRYEHAHVYGWVDEDGVAAGKVRAEADMQKCGWRITGYEVARSFSEAGHPSDLLARCSIRLARHSGSNYIFDRAKAVDARIEAAPPTGDAAPPPEELWVHVDPQSIPPQFRPLLDVARLWAIGDDVDRGHRVRTATMEQKRTFTAAVEPMANELEKWCRAQRDSTPVPIAVTVFDWMLEALAEAQAEMAANE